MYLKQLEIIGFKSFADKTRLTFEPGMIAIVGPNGCGKSNVSDAIRWVLGEQRPSALRCSKMQDIIFNGTDSRKPLGMVEVSLLFSDCEKTLGTEYNEVTITRRSFRDGDNQYLLNKTPCRLKEIQRLFMGTGVGTTSYSVMAQGQIDAILSSRPEDRRAVFEEAAGVTKFKADRREAIRKIEQTEANLVRLGDVIREVKRQAASLQRQSERAERYQILRTEQRGLDVYISRIRISRFEDEITSAAMTISDASIQASELEKKSENITAEITELQAEITNGEEEIAALTKEAAASTARYSRAEEIIRTNTQRMEEYRIWAERDRVEMETMEVQLDEQKTAFSNQTAGSDSLNDQIEAAQEVLTDAQDIFNEHKTQIENARNALQQARNTLVDSEKKTLFFENKLAELDSKHRHLISKKEHLIIEQEEAKKRRDLCIATQKNAEAKLAECQTAADDAREAMMMIDEDRSFIGDDFEKSKAEISKIQNRLSAQKAQLELLTQPIANDKSDAAELLLSEENPFGINPNSIIGRLADFIQIKKEAAIAVEIALSMWNRSIIVKDAETAKKIFEYLSKNPDSGNLQLLVLDGFQLQNDSSNTLADYVVCPNEIRPIVQTLLTNTEFFDKSTLLYKNCSGIRQSTANANDPIARKLLCSEIAENIKLDEQKLSNKIRESENLQLRIQALTSKWNDTRKSLEKTQMLAAQTEGEFSMADRDAKTAEMRFNSIDSELQQLLEQTVNERSERETMESQIKQLAHDRAIATQTTETESKNLQNLEQTFTLLSARLTEARIRCAGLMQQKEHLANQNQALIQRIEEMKRTIESRKTGINSYNESILKLRCENDALCESLGPIELDSAKLQKQIDDVREKRKNLNLKRESLERENIENIKILNSVQEKKSKAEIKMTECRMFRQNALEHLENEYGILEENLPNEPAVNWDETDEKPTEEWIDKRIRTLQQEITNNGPVNLLAIDAYKKEEERYEFLKTQEDDLLQSKTQLLELIKTINETSGKMFRDTFNQANENFAKMFSRLFHGGEAKLILLENEKDPLECGIDIIARPPGKKPQTISLLSGGERTMTAVSLLFAIFLIKPAPFCLLDELDAALDDSNIGRFVEVLKDFLVHSQFLIITHNQHTIAGSDIIYGVTMPEKGVSKTLSMRLENDKVKKL